MNQVIYIGNIPSSCSEAELIDLFSPFGQITHIKIPHNYFKPEEQLNYAFIKLETLGQMEKAISSLHNQFYKEKLLLLKIVEEDI